MLIGAIADLRSFRGHTLLMAGMLGALFVARWLALQVSRLAFRDISAKERELMLWIIPRGLITVVLALQVVAARKEVSFLSALAFAVILVTNVMVVVGSLQAAVMQSRLRRPRKTARRLRSRRLNRARHRLLRRRSQRREAMDIGRHDARSAGLSACILWYGNQPPEQRPRSVQHWMQLHLRRPR